MQRIDIPTAVAVKPAYPAGGVPGFWANCDPNTGDGGTFFDAFWANRVQEEIAGVIEGAEIDLSAADDKQMFAAIMHLIEINQPPPPPVARSITGLSIVGNAVAPTTKIDISFFEAVLTDGISNLSVRHRAGAASVDITALGAGGLDVGAVAASHWYNVFAISDGVTLKGVTSLSATAPDASVLADFPYYMRCGAIRTAANGQLIGSVQRHNRVQYISGGTNLPSLPLMASGVASDLAVDVTAFVPPTALSIQLSLSNVGGVAANIGSLGRVAPNASSAQDNMISLGSSLATSGYVSGTTQGSFILESSNVYYSATVGSGGTPPWRLRCLGWEDNI